MKTNEVKDALVNIAGKHRETAKSGKYLLAVDILLYAITQDIEHYIFVALTTTHKESSFIEGRNYKRFIKELEELRELYLEDIKKDPISMDYLQEMSNYIGITSMPIHSSVCTNDVPQTIIDAIHANMVSKVTMEMILDSTRPKEELNTK